MNYILLTSISSNKDLKSILKEYQLGELSADIFLKAYKWIKDQDKKNELDFMKLDLNADSPDNEKISRNFIDYFPIDTLK
jgi:hypothetical protein